MKIRHYPLSAPFVTEVAILVFTATLIGVSGWIQFDSLAVIGAIFVLMVIVGIFGGGWRRLRGEHRASPLSSTDLARGSWTPGDFAKITGYVRSTSEVRDPVFGTPCCWFRVTFWRKPVWSRAKESDWFSVGLAEDQSDFVLELEPGGSQVRIILDEPIGDCGDTSELLFPDGLNLPSLPLRFRGPVLARAEFARPGDCLTALGTIRKSDDIPALHAVRIRVVTGGSAGGT